MVDQMCSAKRLLAYKVKLVKAKMRYAAKAAEFRRWHLTKMRGRAAREAVKEPRKEKQMKCQECGHELQSANEYHPNAFCLLWKVGINPVEFVYEAVQKMGLLNASGPPIPEFDLPLCDCGMGDGSMPRLHDDDCAINLARGRREEDLTW